MSPNNEFDFYIVLRHNILAGDNDLSWYDYLYNLFGSDHRFAVSVRPVNNWGGQNVNDLSLLNGENKIDLTKIHEDYLKQIGMKYDSSEDLLFGRICYAAFPNGYIIRADGKIEKGSVALNHPQNLVGYIDRRAAGPPRPGPVAAPGPDAWLPGLPARDRGPIVREEDKSGADS